MKNNEPKPHTPYNLELKSFSQKNRKNPTKAEKHMWEILRSGELRNFSITRQKPLSHFIVDFYCAKARLAIEVDGDSHAFAVQYDQERNKKLKALDISVIRFTNQDVLTNPEGIYDSILQFLINSRLTKIE